MHGNQLKRGKLIVPVTDLAHAVTTFANLADIENTIPVNDLDVEVHVAPGTSEFIGVLTGLVEHLEALAKS